MTQETKTAILALGAFFLAGGAFAFASGNLVVNPDSSLAQVVASVSGTPTITITKSARSPQGTLQNNQSQMLAVFDVKARNVSHSATIWNVSGTIELTGPNAQYYLAVENLTASYHYCIPAGTTYGYGYAGGNCGIVPLQVVSNTRSGNAHIFSINGTAPVYPVQTDGQIIIAGSPHYFAPSNTGKLQVVLKNIYASGDQCKEIRYGLKKQYGYSKCVAVKPVVSLGAARGNLLSVQVPEGYGYVKPKPLPEAVYFDLGSSFKLLPKGTAKQNGGEFVMTLNSIDSSTIQKTASSTLSASVTLTYPLSGSSIAPQQVTMTAGGIVKYAGLSVKLSALSASSASFVVTKAVVVPPVKKSSPEPLP